MADPVGVTEPGCDDRATSHQGVRRTYHRHRASPRSGGLLPFRADLRRIERYLLGKSVDTTGLPTDDLFYAEMLVAYSLTPEQVDKLPIKMITLLPVVQRILEGDGGGGK